MFDFEAITRDPEIAKKLLIGSLLALTGIGILALMGWMLEIMHRTQEGDHRLPDFDNIGQLFIDGLKMTAVAVVWSLPLILIIVVFTVVSIFAPSAFADPNDAAMVLIVLNFCIVGLVFIFIIPMLALMVPAFGILADTGSVREAINLKRAAAIFRANPGGILVAVLLGTLANSVLGSIGAILCLIGIYPAFVVSYALQGQLFGKAYRDAKNNQLPAA